MKDHQPSWILKIALIFTLFYFFKPGAVVAQDLESKTYDMGSPVLANIWVDPVHGNDGNDGASRTSALATIEAAWGRVPRTASATGYRINLAAGDYATRDAATKNVVGLYLDERHGSYRYPIVIESADGPLRARIFSPFDFRDVRYVYLIGLDFATDPSSDGGGNTVHFAAGTYILIRNCRMNGFDGTTRKPQETLKVNQVQHMYVEDSDISGAFWFSLDFVAVQYGHIQGCAVHDASEDCLLLKGGTAQVRVEGNWIFNSGRFGISAGQGAGFDFFVVPWLHYEAYDLKFINNIVYNTGYAGAAVLGGYNILVAFNTFYRTGIDAGGDRTLLAFNLGQRGCDGAENDTCGVHHQMGGWGPGPWSVPPIPYGSEVDCIPNKNVYVYNNIIYNPGKDSTIGGHLEIRAPYDGSDQSSTFLQTCNLPKPVLSDDHVRIRGNLIWNGSQSKPLGIDENTGGQDTNEECNRAQMLSDNTINSIEPNFADASRLDFHPAAGGNNFKSKTFAVPGFPGGDGPVKPPVPQGTLGNDIPRDYDGKGRTSSSPPGAFAAAGSTSVKDGLRATSDKLQCVLGQCFPNPFSTGGGSALGGNSEMTIRYQITHAGYVRIKIYNLMGRHVRNLVDAQREAGKSEASWDGRDESGLSLGSGMYLVKIEAGGGASTQKLMLMR